MATMLKPEPAPLLVSLQPDDVLVVFRRMDQGGHLRPRAMRATWETVLQAAQEDLADRIHALEIGAISADKLDVEVKARVDAIKALTKALATEIDDRGKAVAGETEARAKALTDLAARVKLLEDKPALRIARFAGTTNAQGIAAITFTPAFASAPDVDVIEGWSAQGQMLTGALTAAPTKTGCSVQVMVSQGTLLVGVAPFAKAGAGVSITARAIGN